MRKITYSVIVIFTCFVCSCDSSTEPEDNPVQINEISGETSGVNVGDVIKLECKAKANESLKYHWAVKVGNTVYETSIVGRASNSEPFNHGEWINWKPERAGTWEIEVLAYLTAGDHDSEGQGGDRTVYYEHLEWGYKIHCFYESEHGKLWDTKSITIEVSD